MDESSSCIGKMVEPISDGFKVMIHECSASGIHSKWVFIADSVDRTLVKKYHQGIVPFGSLWLLDGKIGPLR